MLLLVGLLAPLTRSQSILCVTFHCLPQITQCYLDSECKSLLDCISKVGIEDKIGNIFLSRPVLV